jgi:regulator of protease activity HflC (stomatin/prohibitin superfamily)
MSTRAPGNPSANLPALEHASGIDPSAVPAGCAVLRRLRPRRVALLALALAGALGATGCATIPPGHAGVVFTPSGVREQPIGEGVALVGPLAEVTPYDLRGQKRNEDLAALSSDGARLQANASLVSYHLVEDEVVALHREVGESYYDALVGPIVRATVRRIVARYPAAYYNAGPDIHRLEDEMTRAAAVELRPRHILLDGLDLRRLAVLSAPLFSKVIETSVWEQRALAAPQQLALARGRAAELHELAGAIAKEHATVAPTLNERTLSDFRVRAWDALLTSPSTSVEVQAANVAPYLEVEP